MSRTKKDRARKPRRKPDPTRSTDEAREIKFKREKGRPSKKEWDWMSAFDSEAFAEAAVADARRVIDKLEVGPRNCAIPPLRLLKEAIETTVAAIEVERDSRCARAFRDSSGSPCRR